MTPTPSAFREIAESIVMDVCSWEFNKTEKAEQWLQKNAPRIAAIENQKPGPCERGHPARFLDGTEADRGNRVCQQCAAQDWFIRCSSSDRLVKQLKEELARLRTRLAEMEGRG